jgi:hypothetical protein
MMVEISHKEMNTILYVMTKIDMMRNHVCHIALQLEFQNK